MSSSSCAYLTSSIAEVMTLSFDLGTVINRAFEFIDSTVRGKKHLPIFNFF